MIRATTMKRRISAVLSAFALLLLAVPAFASDDDGDGLSDGFENDYGTLFNDADSDDDNLTDFEEIFEYGTDPTVADTDGDGTNDDVDSDPLIHSSSTPSGSTTASYTGASSVRPYAWSGESPQDGNGVYVHNGMLEYSTSAGFVYQLQGRWNFWLNYNSQSEWDGAVGSNWTSILDLHVTAVSGHYDMLMPNGHVYRWTDDGNSGWDPPDGGAVPGDVTKDGDEIYWLLPDGQKLTFDLSEDGKLTSWEDRYANALTIAYDANHFATSITDSRGASHTLSWYGTDRLESIGYSDGRTWTLKYDDDNNLTQILGPSSTHFPAGITEEFRYMHGSTWPGMNHNMIRVIDGCGNPWMKVVYDLDDRVTAQTVGYDDYEFDYTNIGSYETTVTDRVGADRVWAWDSSKLTRSSLEQESNLNVRTGDPSSWDTTWTHDTEGYLLTVTLPEGNGTKYSLNDVKRPTEIRQKSSMAAADSSTNDLIQTFTYEDETKFYAIATATDPEGNTTTYTNDANGRPTTITFETVTNTTPNQTITNTRTYNSNGTLASMTDGESKTTSYTYYTATAKKGRVNTVKVDDGGLDLLTTYDYTDFGVRDEVTDPESNTTTMVVDGYGVVTKVTPPTSLGYETLLDYCGNLNLVKRRIKRVDENGTALTAPTHWTTEYFYDYLDNVTQIIEDIDASTTRVTNISYDANENRQAVSRGDVQVSYTYDERDLLYEVTRSPDNGTTEYTSERVYTDNGLLETFENARGYVTTHTYDGFDRRIKTENALDHSTEWTYNKNGNVTEIERYEDNAPSADILLAHQKRHYDELNRLYKIEDVLQGSPDVWLSMTMEYDKRHLVTERTDRGGDATTIGYDGAGRRTSVTDAEGNVTTYTLDDNGNVTKIEEQELNPGSTAQTFETQFTYDAINRRLTQKVIDRNNSSNFKLTQWEYDSLNVAIVTTDPEGYETTVQHDALARITQKSVDLGASAAIVTQWTYDIHDNVTVYTDDNGSDTTYAYDDMNRLETKTYEDTETVDFTYDAVGNVIQIIDQNGTDIDQEFDALNRLTQRDVTKAAGVIGDDDEWFTYDGLNRLTEAKDDDSIVQLTYDSLSRTLTEKQGENPFGSTAKTVEYTYDNDGNLTNVDYPSGFEAVRTYDDIHRVTAIEDGSATDIVDWTFYGAGGRVKEVSFGNTTTTSMTWDGFRRPTEISHENSTPTEFAGFTYAWDKNDNPLYEERSHDSGQGDVYTYDQANRLTKVLTDVADPANEVTNPGTETYTDKVEWTLDDVHNFTSVGTTPYGGSLSSVSYTVNSMNEYTAIGATSRTFDKNGNLTDDGTYEYEYDFHNHLVEVTLKSSSTTIATYSYDALGRGRRWKKVVGSDTTRFIYHDQHVIEEYDGSDNLLRLFVFGQGWDNIVMMEAPDVADVDSDANTTELKRFYYHRQLKGDVTHITDEDEVVVESYEYTPYGEPTIKDIGGSTVSTSQIGNPFLYTGRRLDEETGLYYYRARHYDPEGGRFIQRDPLEYADGPNARTYARNSPIKLVDPRGETSMMFTWPTCSEQCQGPGCGASCCGPHDGTPEPPPPPPPDGVTGEDGTPEAEPTSKRDDEKAARKLEALRAKIREKLPEFEGVMVGLGWLNHPRPPSDPEDDDDGPATPGGDVPEGPLTPDDIVDLVIDGSDRIKSGTRGFPLRGSSHDFARQWSHRRTVGRAGESGSFRDRVGGYWLDWIDSLEADVLEVLELEGHEGWIKPPKGEFGR